MKLFNLPCDSAVSGAEREDCICLEAVPSSGSRRERRAAAQAARHRRDAAGWSAAARPDPLSHAGTASRTLKRLFASARSQSFCKFLQIKRPGQPKSVTIRSMAQDIFCVIERYAIGLLIS